MVLDSSITPAWLYSDERTEIIERVFDDVIVNGAWVPVDWHLEVANGLQQGIRRRRIDANFRPGALADLGKLDITIDPETKVFAWTDTLGFAERFRLTLCDASYLELARRRNLPLGSLDNDLRVAARQCKVELLGQ
jgi:predicted nucleic acid-binding protein